MCSESVFKVDDQSTMRVIDSFDSCAVESMLNTIDHLEIICVLTFFHFDARMFHTLHFDIEIYATFNLVKVYIQLGFSLFRKNRASFREEE